MHHIQTSFIESMRGVWKMCTISLTVHKEEDGLMMESLVERQRKLPTSPSLHLKTSGAYHWSCTVEKWASGRGWVTGWYQYLFERMGSRGIWMEGIFICQLTPSSSQFRTTLQPHMHKVQAFLTIFSRNTNTFFSCYLALSPRMTGSPLELQNRHAAKTMDTASPTPSFKIDRCWCFLRTVICSKLTLRVKGGGVLSMGSEASDSQLCGLSMRQKGKVLTHFHGSSLHISSQRTKELSGFSYLDQYMSE